MKKTIIQQKNAECIPQVFNEKNVSLKKVRQTKKYPEFFSKLFKSTSSLDTFNQEHAKVNYIGVKASQTQEKVLRYDEQKDSANILCVHVEKNASLFLSIYSKKGNYYFGEDIRVIAEEGAEVSITIIQSLDIAVHSFQKRTQVLKKDAKVSITDICEGSLCNTLRLYAFLETSSSFTHTILFSAKQNQHVSFDSHVTHKGEKSNSEICMAGIVTDTARSLSKGCIHIEENAVKSTAHEIQKTLLLDERAKADAVPELDIHTNDIVCSHGSSISSFDKKALYYLSSRGIAIHDAKKLLLQSYFKPFLKNYDTTLKETILKTLFSRMKL